MTERHEVYPGEIGDRVEQHANELGLSVSAYYREAVRQKLQREVIEE